MEFTGYRALVVDDEPYVRDLASRSLAKRSLQCDVASDGEEALVLASRYAYDAVITDLRMPRCHGHSLAAELLAWPNRPKIIVLTGLAEPRLVEDLRHRGVDEVLHKPIDFDELASRVASLIDPAFVDDDDIESPKSQLLLSKIEISLTELSEMFAERLEGIFEVDEALIDPPSAVNDYIIRLEEEEALAEQNAPNGSKKARAAEVMKRRRERARVKAVALAVPVTRHFVRCGQPFSLALRDVSESGVRLLHTRASSSEYLALKWSCQTLPFREIEVVSKVMRCEPLSRFYDYGCQFVLAD
ncbi:Gliding motility regulatory protein [Posidoniimonas polymericola]|uniref:Gliding motility regulatory protein n=1 Tax=Posidoniimonas polymericola TaxID=2528002 RepID=A0A5C5XY86_9BACT|nr:response regulator [Posidoniimonas polymericola]TWT66885.1 Gliding motility regulatory protein [Posidoniimonas polymericola]